MYCYLLITVVWANGMLASNAVGIAFDLLTGWTGNKDRLVYIAFDGNVGELKDHIRPEHLASNQCNHFQIKNSGPVKFTIV